MEKTRLPKCVVVRKHVGGMVSVKGQEKDGMGLDDLRAFGIQTDQWAIVAQDEGEWYKTVIQWLDCSPRNEL